MKKCTFQRIQFRLITRSQKTRLSLALGKEKGPIGYMKSTKSTSKPSKLATLQEKNSNHSFEVEERRLNINIVLNQKKA